MEQRSVFQYTSYTLFTKAVLEQKPNNGWGQFSRLARHLGVTTTYISQVMSDQKCFSLEQAASAAQYLGLSAREFDYYLLLVEHRRAGTSLLKNYLENKIIELQKSEKTLKTKIGPVKKISDRSNTEFYSDWYYSAIRLLCSIPRFQNRHAISERLGLPLSLVNRVIDFLCTQNLVSELKGKLYLGQSKTYIPPDSPLAARQHKNWRIKALNKIDQLGADEMMLTTALTISNADYELLMSQLRELISEVLTRVDKSNPELLVNLNIDLLKY